MRDELRARCGRSLGCCALVAAAVSFCLAPSAWRTPLGAAAGVWGAGAWGAAALGRRPPARTRVAALLAAPRALLPALPAALASAVLAFSWLDRPFGRPCERDPQIRCLEERNLALILSGVWIGLYYFAKEFIRRRPALTFPPIHQKKFVRIKAGARRALGEALKGAVVPTLLFALLYRVKGAAVRNAVAGTFGLAVDDQYSSFALHSLFALWIRSAAFLFVSLFARALFDAFLTERMTFGVEKVDLSASLPEALAGPDEVLAELAARDLFGLSRGRDPRRAAVFSLSQPGGHPTNWKNLYAAAKGATDRYADEIEKLLTDEAGAEPSKRRPPPESPKPALRTLRPGLRSLAPPAFDKSPEPQKTFKIALKEELSSGWRSFKNKPIIGFLFGEPADARIEAIATGGRTVARVCLAVSALAAASIKEDTFGVVQDDLPSAIATLIRLKRLLDRLAKSGLVGRKGPREEAGPTRPLADVRSAIRRSIYRITIAFKDYTGDIALDPETAMSLQTFYNMREG